MSNGGGGDESGSVTATGSSAAGVRRQGPAGGADSYTSPAFGSAPVQFTGGSAKYRWMVGASHATTSCCDSSVTGCSSKT